MSFPLASFGTIASLSSERNAVNKSSALTMNRFPSRCALSCFAFSDDYSFGIHIKAVAEAAVTLRALRQETMRKLNYSLPPRAIFRLVLSV